MQKVKELFNDLELIAPIRYGKFNQAVTPPYLIYLGAGSNNLLADGKVYASEYAYRIEYYFTSKDFTIEEKIETTFNEHKFIWDKSEDIYIQDENMFIIYYEIKWR